MPLHVDYRPMCFDEMVGNEDTISALKAWAAKDARSRTHSLLFIGPSGCGKTTLARIAATELKAYDPEQKAANNPDYTELNAADFKGIEMVRGIRRQMHLRPLKSPCRVWLLDECHKLTTDAQEALLKCLEEPPEHVYFLLATTEPEKLKVTLKRRCSSFAVLPISESESVVLMHEVLSAEADYTKTKSNISEEVLEQIAVEADGSPGIALILLDKVLGLSKNEQLALVKRHAETQNEAIQLCRLLMHTKPSWNAVSGLARGLRGEDPERVRRAVLGYATSVLLNPTPHPRAYVVLDSFMEPLYNSGFPGLVHACYTATHAE